MLKRYHKIVGGIFRVVDAAVIGAAWLLSYILRFQYPIIEVSKGLPPFSQYAALTPLVMILWVLVFSGLRVYTSKRMLRRTHEVHLLIKAHGTALLFFIALTYLFSEYKYSRLVMVYFASLGLFFLIVFRLILRNGLRAIRKKGYNLRYVLGVGEGPLLEKLISKIDKFPELGLKVVGVLTHESSGLSHVNHKPVLGHLRDIKKVLDQNSVDQVLIALPRKHAEELDSLLKDLHDETLDILLVPDVHEYVTLGCEVEDFEGLPVLNLNDSPLEGWGGVAKRGADFLLSAFSLVLFSPFLFLIALVIRLTSKGPVFYFQERMGLDGQTFEMIKFRTMQRDAELESGATWAKCKDPRRTGFGRFLRATSLDEFPQLWNVLKGEMSLVGPRPERPFFVSQFRQDIPHYMLRHKVKAGMTGWAQIHGWRGNTSLPERIECDLYYIRNWSFGLDFKIMASTLWKGFINKNAY